MSSKFFIIVIISIFFLSCDKGKNLIQTPGRIADIKRMLNIQKKLTSQSVLPIWEIFKQPLLESEKQAMEYLYAYMPLSDLADYKPEFLLKNVRLSLKLRQDISWGNSIPEEEFLHFVLPLRINNENLDNFREVMYDEISERIKGLNMKEASLEINHWCHEKVTYRGTDSRTSAPLSTVKKSFGRCGEESTFTVAALRTAGIPARQVYTPRWAHSDDNHAWVEVWINGKWYYMGACEPDVDLNMGWFSEPASRVMLVHTRTYGRYFGSENVINSSDHFSELNLTANYAAVKNVIILVKNSDGTPADSVKVEYQLYNYAEFFPIATGYTDKSGKNNLITGMGDLIIRASKNGKSDFRKLSVPEKDTLELVLGRTSKTRIDKFYDLIPPYGTKIEMRVPEEEAKYNIRRLATEDSIRGVYMKTFKDSAWIANFAEKLKLPFDTISRFFALSYGNWDQISEYLIRNPPISRNLSLGMAMQLSDKDFSDVTEPVLTDHLLQTSRSGVQNIITSKEIFTRYVLSPRISIEKLTSWRGFLSTAFGPEMAKSTIEDISVLTNWIRKNIRIDKVANNHSRTPISPVGVYNLRVSDPISRDIFFVAACRTFGIPARLNDLTRVPEYFKNGEWLSAGIESQTLVQAGKGLLKLTEKNNLIKPQYYLHYTIAKLDDGFYHTLEFPEGKKLFNADDPVLLESGNYALTTGNRLEDGSVLSRMISFTIEKGKLTAVPVEIRKQQGEIKPLGKLKLDQLKLEKTGVEKTENLSSLAAGRYLVLILLDPDKEPSKHILNDLGPYTDHYNKWSGQFVFVVPEGRSVQKDVLKTYKLPDNMNVGMDWNGSILNAVSAIYGTGLKNKLPLVVLCNESGNIYMYSSGYKIGVGELLLKVIALAESNRKMTTVIASCKK